MLISRTWHGAVPLEQADRFAEHLEQTGVRHSRSIAGNAGAHVQRADQGDCAHFFLCTLWTSWDAVRAFAGANPAIAVTYPDDARFGLISDPIVIHQEVLSGRNPFDFP